MEPGVKPLITHDNRIVLSQLLLGASIVRSQLLSGALDMKRCLNLSESLVGSTQCGSRAQTGLPPYLSPSLPLPLFSVSSSLSVPTPSPLSHPLSPLSLC